MRIVGISIPDQKRIETALTYIYGVGSSTSKRILSATKISPAKRAKDLTSEETRRIQDYLEKNHKVEGELRQIVRQNIQRLKEIKSYRGVRHMKRLPVRGQRTKTNSRTVRGNVRKTAGSGRRKAELK
ncbi:MAG: 30S ribosomal protein S13 [Candidatus Liptonbacteria bacterium GWC1_60_9]|uniref:Small ribosomal subunit protein uS13 n=3 Tax=Candidatus Liptoniibacteriota TaxID=1817909 RepID=A0A1G2CN56_9BACT|nr:MAG: 30S ribosomal protein S13 [Parcubacteria group bacterium GW2011_GWA1_60_11]OGY97057.1 MAG: 30S ribosomal protein S13 [Candidatus Liptonbacteria bacterium GWC1_60_9]OGY98433.1 MAG: 30S ribosomal protein S13 [Candidatus Liptonbacteria bacterium RIFCSPHIGHO2_12_FULL_60_13]OGZ02836.1 MAG: 30S ribosomal protein S13 [Candidatus Liptonbacteria bacterium RIFCSPLOWO2_12_FULL_60_15]